MLWDGTRVEHVVALLRPGGSTERLDEVRPDVHLSFERANMNELDDLQELLRRVRPRAVVNAALDPEVFSSALVGHAPLETLFGGLSGAAGARLVHAGSAWVLGAGIQLDEAAAVDPRSPYARHKAEEDELLPELGSQSDVSWINLRLFNVFGRYEKPSRLLPYLVSQLSRGEPAEISQGDQVRDFNDVDDIAEAFVLALGAPEGACGALYHVGTGRATTVRELALAVAELVGDPGQIRFGAGQTSDQELAALVADPSLARRVLGWRPDESLEERIAAAADWWLARISRPVGQRPRQEESLR